MKFRLREKFTSEIFYRQKYPNLVHVNMHVVEVLAHMYYIKSIIFDNYVLLIYM